MRAAISTATPRLEALVTAKSSFSFSSAISCPTKRNTERSRRRSETGFSSAMVIPFAGNQRIFSPVMPLWSSALFLIFRLVKDSSDPPD